MFGRKIGDRLGVSEAQWGRFVDREISPRFPDGLTVLDAKGEWRDTARNTIVHEPSKVVEIVLPGKPDDVDELNEIAAAYKVRFRQQSVGIVIRAPACRSSGLTPRIAWGIFAQSPGHFLATSVHNRT